MWKHVSVLHAGAHMAQTHTLHAVARTLLSFRGLLEGPQLTQEGAVSQPSSSSHSTSEGALGPAL